MSDKEAFYTKLKAQLEDTTTFPADYLYKFIVPTDENQAQETKDLFNEGGAVITTRKSKTGKLNPFKPLFKKCRYSHIHAKITSWMSKIGWGGDICKQYPIKRLSGWLPSTI